MRLILFLVLAGAVACADRITSAREVCTPNFRETTCVETTQPDTLILIHWVCEWDGHTWWCHPE